jgi:SAM-dependent methyltransferase
MLATDVQRLVEEVALPVERRPGMAIDIGCGESPYRTMLESCGFVIKTLDLDNNTSPDYVGSVENTGLPDASVDLVICTQVLEHCLNPSDGLREIFRILRPKGYLIASAPHVWFYHPHPTDNWRFTQEGIVRLVSAPGLRPKMLLSQGGSILAYFQIVNFLLFGILGKAGAPFYAINNILGVVGDKLLANTLFCLNFAILASKP